MSIAKRRPLLGKAAWLHSKPSDSWRRRARPSRQSRPNDGGPYESAHMKAPMSMDWDKLKVFHAAAQAGSFTHAGEQLGLSQSAVSRQVSALEQELGVSLFHRHARGLILTEQGELLHHTAHDVFMKLEAVRAKLTDSRERPNGDLRVTTTPGIGVHWLTPRLGEFVELYPDINLTLITTDEELDLAMREADVAIRLRQPTQPDLIQRKLFSVRFHGYASPEYIKRFGTPRALDDLDNHRVLLLGGSTVPNYLENRRWLIEVARNGKGPRTPTLTINTVLGVLRACQRGIGVALLPDYLVEENGGLVQLFGESDTIALDAYFVYPEELKSVARVQVFRDFLVAKAQRWHF
jgi:DNA-binding transcriptional LysR family regulator